MTKEKKSWEEFRGTGMLLFVNMFLQIFGWSIVLEADANDLIQSAYPARVDCKGFDTASVDNAYSKIDNFIKKEYSIKGKEELK